jgi:translation initiation factor 2 subunit 1
VSSVELCEYNRCEGMILLSEVSRRRIRSINKLLKVGRLEVALVLRVDEAKGYIDLSKRRVTPEDAQSTMARYTSSKAVHQIMRHVAEVTGASFPQLCEQITWPLYAKWGHAIAAFQAAIHNPDKALEGIEITPEVRKSLLLDIGRRLTPQPIRFRADVEVTAYTYEGVNALRTALLAGEACSTETVKVNVKLVAPPLYVVLCTSLDRDEGIRLLEVAVEAISNKIKELGGNITVKVAPRIVSAHDDTNLASLMELLAKKNEEKDGDDDSEGGDDDDDDDDDDDEGDD